MAEKPTPKTQRELSSEIAINAALPSAQKPPSKQTNRRYKNEKK